MCLSVHASQNSMSVLLTHVKTAALALTACSDSVVCAHAVTVGITAPTMTTSVVRILARMELLAPIWWDDTFAPVRRAGQVHHAATRLTRASTRKTIAIASIPSAFMSVWANTSALAMPVMKRAMVARNAPISWSAPLRRA